MKMQWKELFRICVPFQALILAVKVTSLHSASPAQVVFPETSLREPSFTVYELTLSPSFAFKDASVLPVGEFFTINSTTLVVSNTRPVPSGRYLLTILIYSTDPMAFPTPVSLTVDVTPEASQACELQLFGECSQSCILESTDTSTYGYSCTCAEGYILQQDGLTCLAFDPYPSLLVRADGDVTQMDLLTRQKTPLSLEGTVDLFGYLYDNKMVFYTDNDRSVISTLSMVTGEESVFQSYGPETVYGLAVNWVDRTLIYSTDSSIVEVDIDTGVNRTLHTTASQAKHLVVYANAEQRVLFWSEEQVIRRCILNGSEPEDVHTGLMEQPLDMSVDLVNGELYWVTAVGNVCVSALNGGNMRCFVCCTEAVPSGLAVFEVFIYVSLGTSNTVVQLNKQDLGSESPTQIVYEGITSPSGLVIVHPLKEPFRVRGPTSCADCEQLCVVGVDSVRCDCSPGYRLSADGTSCFTDEALNVILAQSFETGETNVVKVAPNGREIERLVDISSDSSRGIKTGDVYAMDYDWENGMLFYGDRDSCTVWRVPLNRVSRGHDGRELLFSGVCAWDLAFDWIRGDLYWSDDQNSTVGVASRFGTDEVSLTSLLTELNQPRGLDIDPVSRELYWVESGSGTLWSFHVDDQLPRVVLNGLSDPSGLVIDHRGRALYWSELSGSIGRVSFGGENRETVYSNPSAMPVKIELFKEYLLWVDAINGSFNVIGRGNTDVRGRVPLESTNQVLSGLLVVGTNRQLSLGMYKCIRDKPGCSHYCNVDEQNIASCSCPPNYTISSDRTTCSYDGVCPECTGGGECMIQGSNVTCSCPPGFMGPACDELCAEGTFGEGCAQQCTCLNGGDCNPVNGSCNCTEGYEGADCGQAICTEECQNGGTCSAPDFCSCRPTFGGPTCVQRVCTSDYCLNGGTCIENFGFDLSCSCPSDTSGSQCQFIDIIFFPQTALAVGTPIGVVLIVIVVIVLLGIAIFYYVKCIPHRKTNPLESQTEKPPARKYISPEPSEAGDTVTNSIFTGPGSEHEGPDTPYHMYVKT